MNNLFEDILLIASCIQRGNKAAKEILPQAYMEYAEDRISEANAVRI